MDKDRFETLAAAYGGDLRRWPEAERAAAEDFRRGNPEAAAAMRLLYGGSVNGDNAAELLGAGDVDGALVGGASLTAEKFLPIVAAAATLG